MATATIPEKERIEILRSVRGKSVADLDTEVNYLLEKIMLKKASADDRRRAAVLATVVLDRTGRTA